MARAPKYQVGDEVCTDEGPGYVIDLHNEQREGYPAEWWYLMDVDGVQLWLSEEEL